MTESDRIDTTAGFAEVVRVDRRTARRIAESQGATLKKHTGYQCYEVTDRRGTVYTISGDFNDAGRLRWYCREGAFPGGAPFEAADALWYAVYICATNTAGDAMNMGRKGATP